MANRGPVPVKSCFIWSIHRKHKRITKEMTMAATKSEVIKIKHLPPLSATATRLLELVGDPNVEIDDLTQIIDRDPALSARILGLANSAYFAQSRPIHRVRDAIIRVLGLNMVKSLALSIAMCGAFDTRKCKGFNLEEYWCAALGSAAMSQAVATQTHADQALLSDSVYLCGMMWNLGALVLAHLYPEGMSQVYATLAEEPEADARALERQYIGFDSQQAGAWVAQRWHMPEAVVTAIVHQGDVNYQGAHEGEVLITGAVAQWISGYLAGDEALLSEADPLVTRMEIGRDALRALDTRFREQCEELRATARLLV